MNNCDAPIRRTRIVVIFVAWLLLIGMCVNLTGPGVALARNGALVDEMVQDEALVRASWSCEMIAGMVRFDDRVLEGVGDRVIEVEIDDAGNIRDNGVVARLDHKIVSMSAFNGYIVAGLNNMSVIFLVSNGRSNQLVVADTLVLPSNIERVVICRNMIVIVHGMGFSFVEVKDNRATINHEYDSSGAAIGAWDVAGEIVTGEESELGGVIIFWSIEDNMISQRETVSLVSDPEMISFDSQKIYIFEHNGRITILNSLNKALISIVEGNQFVLGAIAMSNAVAVAVSHGLVIFDSQSERVLVAIDAPWGNSAVGMWVIDEMIIIAGKDGGLTTVRVHESRAFILGYQGSCAGSFVGEWGDDYGIVGNEKRLWVIDVDESSGSIEVRDGVDGGCVDIAIDRNRIWCAAGKDGLRRGDLDMDGRITWEKQVALAGYAIGVSVNDVGVLVAAGTQGIYIVDDESLDVLRRVDVPGYAQGVRSIGGAKFVATRFAGLQLVQEDQSVSAKRLSPEDIEENVSCLSVYESRIAVGLWGGGVLSGFWDVGKEDLVAVHHDVAAGVMTGVDWGGGGLLWSSDVSGKARLTEMSVTTSFGSRREVFHWPLTHVAARRSGAMVGVGRYGIAYLASRYQRFVPQVIVGQ